MEIINSLNYSTYLSSLLLYCLVSQTVYVVTVRTHRPVIKQKYTNFPSNCENGEEY